MTQPPRPPTSRSVLTFIVALTQFLGAATGLVVAMEVLISHFDPQAQCDPRIEELRQLSTTKTTDELFFAAHPERSRRLILRNESKAIKQEWYALYTKVEACRQRK
jgi:hypothetical protein